MRERAPLPRLQAHFILPHLNESAIFLSFHLQNASEGEEGEGGRERGGVGGGNLHNSKWGRRRRRCSEAIPRPEND